MLTRELRDAKLEHDAAPRGARLAAALSPCTRGFLRVGW